MRRYPDGPRTLCLYAAPSPCGTRFKVGIARCVYGRFRNLRFGSFDRSRVLVLRGHELTIRPLERTILRHFAGHRVKGPRRDGHTEWLSADVWEQVRQILWLEVIMWAGSIEEGI